MSKQKNITLITKLGVALTEQVPYHRPITDKEYIVTLPRQLVEEILDEFQTIAARKLLKQLKTQT